MTNQQKKLIVSIYNAFYRKVNDKLVVNFLLKSNKNNTYETMRS